MDITKRKAFIRIFTILLACLFVFDEACLLDAAYAAQRMPRFLKAKKIKVGFLRNKKGKRIEYGRAAKQRSKGYRVLQGACTDGKYSYHVLFKKNSKYCKLVKISPKTNGVIKVSKTYKLSHGNDMAFDSKRNRLIVAHGDGDTKRLSVFDPGSLKRKKVIKLKFNRNIKGIKRKNARKIKGVTGIAYDEKRDRFIASVKSTYHYIELDSGLVPVRYIKTKTRGKLTLQGLIVCNGHILRVMNKFKKKKVKSYIYVYNLNGKYKKRVKIATSTEPESLYFLNNRLYFPAYVEKPSNRKKNKGYSYILRTRKLSI